MCHTRKLLPQLLADDGQLMTKQEPAFEGARHMHAVSELSINEHGTLLAVVKSLGVSILECATADASSDVQAHANSSWDLKAKFEWLFLYLGLNDCKPGCRDLTQRGAHGWYKLDARERWKLVQEVGLEPGSAQKLIMRLDGRLPLPTASSLLPSFNENCISERLLKPLMINVAAASLPLHSYSSHFAPTSTTLKNATRALQVLQVEWHPLSGTHLGVLYGDARFCLFDRSVAPAGCELLLDLRKLAVDR